MTSSHRSRGPRLLAALLALCSALALTACDQSIDDDDDAPLEGNFLRLQGFAVADSAEGDMQGFLRWVFLDENPDRVEDPEARCEIWELLELSAVEADPACDGCTEQFEGTATVQADDTTCTDLSWTSRSFTAGFGPLDTADPEQATLADQGYSHAVRTRWSPDLGDSSGFQLLFAAEPELWAPDQSEPAGTVGDEALHGQYHWYCLYFWDLP